MSRVVIKSENISKQYRLGLVGTGTVRDDFKRWWHSVRGKEDPFLKIGEVNDRSSKGESDYVWSLKDVNFEINQGDSVGIIGRNGAGKSTLLKILSQVTQPTTGKIYTKGRIASLLEVGTGFHPEMTGRENIYLNGAILGMRKHEISRKFDEIVAFSGVEVPCQMSAAQPAVNDLFGRTFSMWTATSCMLCLCCAKNPTNQTVYGAPCIRLRTFKH